MTPDSPMTFDLGKLAIFLNLLDKDFTRKLYAYERRMMGLKMFAVKNSLGNNFNYFP